MFLSKNFDVLPVPIIWYMGILFDTTSSDILNSPCPTAKGPNEIVYFANSPTLNGFFWQKEILDIIKKNIIQHCFIQLLIAQFFRKIQ